MTSIIISDLSWSTADGRPVFANLNITFGGEKVGLVGRNGVGKSTFLKIIAGDLRSTSGSTFVDGKVGMLQQAVGDKKESIADLFRITPALKILQRAEAGQATVDELSSADWTLEDRVVVSLARVGLEATTSTLLSELSGGQRTRAGLAAVMFAEPDFLLLDEPTNNLDRVGRRSVLDALSTWQKGAVVVSHDRELLETMDSIVELTSLGMSRYGGNWSYFQERKAAELSAAEHDLSDAERRLKHTQRMAQVAAERKDRRDASGAQRRDRGDLPKILLGARKNTAENSGGAGKRLVDRRKEEAAGAVASARSKLEILQHLSISLPPTGLSNHRKVLQLEKVCAGYLAEAPIISDFSLSISGPERVALVGPNGSGKTTLLKVITGGLSPFSGEVKIMVPFALLDQSVSILHSTASITENFMRINAGATENECRSALAGFLFRADAALQPVQTLSGGQMLRAGLACVLGGRNPPALLILDEPTNHLDIESVEAIEDALIAYDGALLVVSHDEKFLSGLSIARRIEFTLGSQH
jgi:ATPase subunit of ABC transporter with duplicated ATPase domains